VLLESDNYVLENGLIRKLDPDDISDNQIIQERLETALDLKIVGIVRPSDDSMGMANIGTIGYMPSLMEEVIERVNKSDVVKAQLKDMDVDLFTGIRFDSKGYTIEDLPELKKLIDLFPNIDTSEVLDSIFDKINIPYIEELLGKYLPTDINSFVNMVLNYVNKDKVTTNTYKENLKALGYVDINNPSSISIYPKDFESKEKINQMIADYNNRQGEKDRIIYSDTVALLMSSVTTIVDAISYVLIAFVAISLVVSSIMIGIITYISVLERTKEIGVLRAIGASKRDIGRVFNTETIFVGLVAGLIGIVCSWGLIIVINIVLYHFTGLATLKAVLEPIPAIILVLISVGLTFIAGLFPSKTASNKDPVIALRTE
jgi:putative ABC transport system permease protein